MNLTGINGEPTFKEHFLEERIQRPLEFPKFYRPVQRFVVITSILTPVVIIYIYAIVVFRSEENMSQSMYVCHFYANKEIFKQTLKHLNKPNVINNLNLECSKLYID